MWIRDAASSANWSDIHEAIHIGFDFAEVGAPVVPFPGMGNNPEAIVVMGGKQARHQMERGGVAKLLGNAADSQRPAGFNTTQCIIIWPEGFPVCSCSNRLQPAVT